MKYDHFSMLPERAFQPRNGRFGGMTLEGGGGGGSQTSTTYTSNIPEWLRPQTEAMLGAATQEYFTTKPGADGKIDITGIKPYTPYSTPPQDYIAGFSPLQEQAQYEVAGMQRPGQFGAATAGAGTGMGLGYGAGMAGLGAAFTDPTQMMSPYMQGVVDVQKSKAIEDAQKAQLAANLGAARQGTYGGARQLLATTEREKALQSQMEGIQAKGLQDAYTAAAQRGQMLGQLGAQGLGMGLQGAQQMGALGTQQQAADLQRVQAQAEMGASQQAMEQAYINQAIQNYAMAQQYPYQQLAAYSGLLRGYATPTTTVSQYSSAPSFASQAAGLGTAAIGVSQLAGLAKKSGGKIEDDGAGIDDLMIRRTLEKVSK